MRGLKHSFEGSAKAKQEKDKDGSTIQIATRRNIRIAANVGQSNSETSASASQAAPIRQNGAGAD